MDPYQSPDNQSVATIEAMVQRLEDRGENAKFNSFIDQYLEKIDFSRVKSVLDLGCGTGVVTRRVFQHVRDEVNVIGADISNTFLDVARERSDPRIQWQLCDPTGLRFEDGSMDLVIMHTLLTHVPDPVVTLKEARRVLSEDGTIIIFDADYASTTYAIDDFERGREIDLKLLGAVVHNLNVCRMMPRHLFAAGLTLESHQGHVLSEAGKGDFWLSSVEGFAKLIPALDILPEKEGLDWVEQMLESHEKGTFFATSNYYTYFAKK